MSQSTLIAIVIVAAWLIFITARGRLPAYMAVFGLTQGSGTATETKSAGDTSQGSATGTTSPASTVTNWLTGILGPNFGTLFGTPVLPGMK